MMDIIDHRCKSDVYGPLEYTGNYMYKMYTDLINVLIIRSIFFLNVALKITVYCCSTLKCTGVSPLI